MAKSEATIIDAGGRDLRVSSPDRVIFPMTERSDAVTTLDIVNDYRPRQVLVHEAAVSVSSSHLQHDLPAVPGVDHEVARLRAL